MIHCILSTCFHLRLLMLVSILSPPHHPTAQVISSGDNPVWALDENPKLIRAFESLKGDPHAQGGVRDLKYPLPR
jgi:hypothetical protein